MSKDSVVQSMLEKGFTYLGCFGGKELFCNLKSDGSIKRCLEYLKNVTAEEWSYFQEEYGNCNAVLYKTRSFEQRNGYLHFKAGSIELPLNCGSCYRIFNWCKLEESLSLDTSKIKCMKRMFLNCSFSEDFLLDLDTSCVVNAEGMFTGCCINKDLSLVTGLI